MNCDTRFYGTSCPQNLGQLSGIGFQSFSMAFFLMISDEGERSPKIWHCWLQGSQSCCTGCGISSLPAGMLIRLLWESRISGRPMKATGLSFHSSDKLKSIPFQHDFFIPFHPMHTHPLAELPTGPAIQLFNHRRVSSSARTQGAPLQSPVRQHNFHSDRNPAPHRHQSSWNPIGPTGHLTSVCSAL